MARRQSVSLKILFKGINNFQRKIPQRKYFSKENIFENTAV
jgi:hypothetical protein